MMTSRWARVGAWTTAGVLGAGLASGVTWAAASGGSTSGSHGGHATTSQSQRSQARQTRTGARHMRRGRARLLRRVEHGELTLRAKSGDLTVDVQRGTASDVSSSAVTVTSHDGYAKTYDVTSSSIVRAHGKKSTTSAVKNGDLVFVTSSGGDVRRLFDPRPGHSAPSSGTTG